MNDAIEQRVEQFVQEILGLVEQMSTARRAAALGAVATLLSDAARPRKARVAPARKAAAGNGGSRKAASPPKPRKGPRRAPEVPPRAAVSEATQPMAAS